MFVVVVFFRSFFVFFRFPLSILTLFFFVVFLLFFVVFLFFFVLIFHFFALLLFLDAKFGSEYYLVTNKFGAGCRGGGSLDTRSIKKANDKCALGRTLVWGRFNPRQTCPRNPSANMPAKKKRLEIRRETAFLRATRPSEVGALFLA